MSNSTWQAWPALAATWKQTQRQFIRRGQHVECFDVIFHRLEANKKQKPNIGKLGFRLEIRFQGEYQIVVTLVEANLDNNN